METLEKQPHSKDYLQKRRLMLVLPLIMLPFITILFWLFGGGTGKGATKTVQLNGINVALPGAENKADSTMDKMGFYKQAETDSIAKAHDDSKDPYLSVIAAKYVDTAAKGANKTSFSQAPTDAYHYGGSSFNDPNEAKIQQKLAALNATLNAPRENTTAANPSLTTDKSSPVSGVDVDRLEALMKMQQQGNTPDPEMQQLNGMLDQILDIQHPERVQERLKASSAKARGQVFAVSANQQSLRVSTLDNPQKTDSNRSVNGFYSFNAVPVAEENQNAIKAAVYETQTVTTGSIIKLRLLDDVFINGQLIPKNTFLFGQATISGERLNVEIPSIRYANSIFPVKLTLYDLDGLTGIYIPGSISRDVAKNTTDQTLSNISFGANSIDPSLTTQAMGVGVEAAKGLMSKKIKLVRASIKAGYQVLLKDDKTEKQSN